MSRYEEAKKMYAAYGIDTEAAIGRLGKIPVSVHCWQGDDVLGFEGGGSLDGGIQTTGNYPGKARTPEELFEDAKKAFSLMPGKNASTCTPAMRCWARIRARWIGTNIPISISSRG